MPVKVRYFWDFGWSWRQKLTSTTQNFHFGITFEISISNGHHPIFLVLFWQFFQKLHFLEFWACDVKKNWRQTENWRQHWRQKKSFSKIFFLKMFKMQNKHQKMHIQQKKLNCLMRVISGVLAIFWQFWDLSNPRIFLSRRWQSCWKGLV